MQIVQIGDLSLIFGGATFDKVLHIMAVVG